MFVKSKNEFYLLNILKGLFMNNSYNKIFMMAILTTIMLAVATSNNANSQHSVIRALCSQRPELCCKLPDSMYRIKHQDGSVHTYYATDYCKECLHPDELVPILTHILIYCSNDVQVTFTWSECDEPPTHPEVVWEEKICCENGEPDTIRWNDCDIPDPAPDCIEYGEDYTYTCCEGTEFEKTFTWNDCWGEQPPCPSDTSKVCEKTGKAISWKYCEKEPDCEPIEPPDDPPDPPEPCDPESCDGIKVNFRIFNPQNLSSSLTFVEHFVNLVADKGGKTCCEGVTEWKQIPCDLIGADAYVDACVSDEEMAKEIIEAWANAPQDRDFYGSNGELIGGAAGSPNAFGGNSWIKLGDDYGIINPEHPLDGSPVIKCQCLGK